MGLKTMEDLFRSYWWLLFPLGWFVFGGLQSVIDYFRHKDTLKIIKTYADKGEQPPEALMKALEQPDYETRSSRPYRYRYRSHGERGNAFSVVLFGVLALGFGYASYSNMYGAGDAFLIVAFVMGALALASLVSVLLAGRGPQD